MDRFFHTNPYNFAVHGNSYCDTHIAWATCATRLMLLLFYCVLCEVSLDLVYDACAPLECPFHVYLDNKIPKLYQW